LISAKKGEGRGDGDVPMFSGAAPVGKKKKSLSCIRRTGGSGFRNLLQGTTNTSCRWEENSRGTKRRKKTPSALLLTAEKGTRSISGREKGCVLLRLRKGRGKGLRNHRSRRVQEKTIHYFFPEGEKGNAYVVRGGGEGGKKNAPKWRPYVEERRSCFCFSQKRGKEKGLPAPTSNVEGGKE